MPRPTSIAHASCIGPTNLKVTWDDGSSSCVDLAGWIAGGGPDHALLKQPRRFATVTVGEDGTGLVWWAFRISAAHLRCIAAEQRAFSRADLVAWQAEIALSNQEAAEFLGISLSAWNAYKAGTNPVPAPVGIVCRAALRDPILCQARQQAPDARPAPQNRGGPSLGPCPLGRRGQRQRCTKSRIPDAEGRTPMTLLDRMQPRTRLHHGVHVAAGADTIEPPVP